MTSGLAALKVPGVAVDGRGLPVPPGEVVIAGRVAYGPFGVEAVRGVDVVIGPFAVGVVRGVDVVIGPFAVGVVRGVDVVIGPFAVGVVRGVDVVIGALRDTGTDVLGVP